MGFVFGFSISLLCVDFSIGFSACGPHVNILLGTSILRQMAIFSPISTIFPLDLNFLRDFLLCESNQKDSTGKKFSQAKYKSNAVPHSEEEVRKKTLKAHIGHTPLPNQLGNYNIIHFICCNNICFSFGSFCYSGLILILHSFAFKSIGCCLFCSSSSRID